MSVPILSDWQRTSKYDIIKNDAHVNQQVRFPESHETRHTYCTISIKIYYVKEKRNDEKLILHKLLLFHI